MVNEVDPYTLAMAAYIALNFILHSPIQQITFEILGRCFLCLLYLPRSSSCCFTSVMR